MACRLRLSTPASTARFIDHLRIDGTRIGRTVIDRTSIDRRGRAAWLTLAALLGGGAVAATVLVDAGVVAPTSIDWQPALALSQPWRALTAAWLHYSTLHLVANLAGCALVALLGVVARLPLRTAVAWCAAWPLTQFGLLVRPDLLHYGGLSGVLHAGVVVATLYLSIEVQGARRRIGVAMLVGVSAKVMSEAPWAEALRHPPGWDIAVAPFAHASGLLAGLAAAAVACGLGRRRYRRMRPTSAVVE